VYPRRQRGQPGNITVDDTSYATTTASTADGSDYLIARNFGFASPDQFRDHGRRLHHQRVGTHFRHRGDTTKAPERQRGSRRYDDAVTFSGTTKTSYTAGATTNDWAASLTPDIVNNANFGVRAWFLTAHNVEVDWITLQLTYVTTHTRRVPRRRDVLVVGTREVVYTLGSGARPCHR